MALKLEPAEWNYREMQRQLEKFLPYGKDLENGGDAFPVSVRFLENGQTRSLADLVGWVECNPEAAEALVSRFEN